MAVRKTEYAAAPGCYQHPRACAGEISTHTTEMFCTTLSLYLVRYSLAREK